jgi:hypothetical protein
MVRVTSCRWPLDRPRRAGMRRNSRCLRCLQRGNLDTQQCRVGTPRACGMDRRRLHTGGTEQVRPVPERYRPLAASSRDCGPRPRR